MKESYQENQKLCDYFLSKEMFPRPWLQQAACCSMGMVEQCTGCIIANLMPALFVAAPPRLPPRNLLSPGTSQTVNSMWAWASNTCSIKLSYVYNGLFSPVARLFNFARFYPHLHNPHWATLFQNAHFKEGSILLLLFIRRFSLVANFSHFARVLCKMKLPDVWWHFPH